MQLASKSSHQQLLALYRQLGLLPLFSSFSLLLAALVQHLSRLPGPYTWLEPLWTLRSVLGEARFPVALLLTCSLASWTRRGTWDVLGAARWLARRTTLHEYASQLLPRALLAATLVAADAVLLKAERDWLDLLCLCVLGACISRQPRARTRVISEVGYAAVSSLLVLLICYGFTVSKALIFVPGRTYDSAIVGLESSLLGFVPHRVLATLAAAHPSLVAVCDWVYFHFFEHMALTTVLLVALRKRAQRTEYLGALALCYLVGGLAYQLFPARGPGYFEPQYFAYLQQPSLITGGIRSWLEYNTEGVVRGTARELRTWGYIACMPSLHVAHELVMLYYSRHSRPAFLLAGAFTLLTLLSVVVLGWHYPLDSLGGAIVALIAVGIARWQGRALMPAWLALGDDCITPPKKPIIVPFLKAYRVERKLRTARSG